MHCKACDRRMDDKEMDAIKPDGTPEDLCTSCLKSALISAGIWEEDRRKEITFTEAGIDQNKL